MVGGGGAKESEKEDKRERREKERGGGGREACILTLGVCTRVTVVVLCVSMCICYHASCHIPERHVCITLN